MESTRSLLYVPPEPLLSNGRLAPAALFRLLGVMSHYLTIRKLPSLPTGCVNGFRMILRINILYISSINCFIYLVKTQCVFCDAGNPKCE
jgi:hypothetical protein